MNKYLVLVLIGLLSACSDTNDDELTCEDGMCVEETEGTDAGGVADKDGGANLALKTQALGSACTARVFGMPSTSDATFNSSGWEGEWFLFNDAQFLGVRACEYNTYGLHYVAKNVNGYCSPVAGSNKKSWICGGFNRVDCPTSAQTANVSSYRQSSSGTKVWGTPGPITMAGVPHGGYEPNSASFDSANGRIWCGYRIGVVLSFSRPETF